MYYYDTYGEVFTDIPIKELSTYNEFSEHQEAKLNELLQLLQDGNKISQNDYAGFGASNWYKKNTRQLSTLLERYKAAKRGIAVMNGANSPKKPRRKLPISKLIRFLIRKNRQGSAADLWNLIPKDMVGGIRIDEHKFYRNGEQLLALGKVDGCKDMRPVGKPLKIGAFKKRVGKERKHPAR